jgi:hypothetical protein
MAIDQRAFWNPDQNAAVPYGVTPHGPIGPTITSDSCNDITLHAKDVKIELLDGTKVTIKEILDRLKLLEETIGIERVLLGDQDTK